ncbi:MULTISPECIES: hypothetical protein [Mycobacterium]|jgi:hypothetical protein|nr:MULTISPECIES: hypothetical protein [Mycobacterium]MCA4760879.1 hypothetical protein [Mycobacterium avium subsp. hominissuis]UXA06553.1 hypothetical protein KXD96_27695 [Mycobacterium sp. SMC-2]UXA09645.1 hypothetical protein KXD96_28220 [Mycobacterium sp. SMC-2]
MSRHVRRLCPVCWTRVHRTPVGKIAGHFDKARQYCPASWETYAITIGAA